MKNLKIVAIQEGSVIPDNIVKKYQLSYTDFSENNNLESISSFCGVVQRGTTILVSFPKHYISLDKFNQLSTLRKISHVRLILNTIVSYEMNPAYSSFRKKDDMNTSFSFTSFFHIYDYFKKYGLYFESKENIKKGYNGKIFWKNTIHQSKKIISGGKLIFLPFFLRQNTSNENFITDCMVFAINYTEELFGDLIDLPDNSSIASRGVDKNIKNNNDAVIYNLEMMKKGIFKDIDKKLLNDLINFFRGINGNLHNIEDIKHYHFNIIWEKAVEKYLNDHFVGVKNNNLIFETRGNKFKFSKLVLKNYNTALKHNKDTLQPDHYYNDRINETQYIFDSKYYNHLDELNNKQFVYHMMLSNRAKNTIDALIMPSEDQTFTEVHLDLSRDYLPMKSKNVKILLCHIKTQDVLENFTSIIRGSK